MMTKTCPVATAMAPSTPEKSSRIKRFKIIDFQLYDINLLAYFYCTLYNWGCLHVWRWYMYDTAAGNKCYNRLRQVKTILYIYLTSMEFKGFIQYFYINIWIRYSIQQCWSYIISWKLFFFYLRDSNPPRWYTAAMTCLHPYIWLCRWNVEDIFHIKLENTCIIASFH